MITPEQLREISQLGGIERTLIWAAANGKTAIDIQHLDNEETKILIEQGYKLEDKKVFVDDHWIDNITNVDWREQK